MTRRTPAAPSFPRRRDLRALQARRTARRTRGFIHRMLAVTAVSLMAAGTLAPAVAGSLATPLMTAEGNGVPQSLGPVATDVSRAGSAKDGYTFTAGSPMWGGVALTPYEHTADTFVNNPDSDIQWPFTQGVPITSGFGFRNSPCGGCSSDHQGLDLTPGVGTPIRSIAAGVVSETGGPYGNYGQYVVVDHLVEGRVVRSLYAHMLAGSSRVREGDYVAVGDELGLVGNTGRSTGAHLHLELQVGGIATDPRAWLQSRVTPR